MTNEYTTGQMESDLHILSEQYNVDEKTLNAYAAEIARLKSRGLRWVRYDFVEGTTAAQRLDAALEITRAINAGEYDDAVFIDV